MNRLLIVPAFLALVAGFARGMDNAQYYIDRSTSMIDSLGRSFKGPDAKDLVIAFKACKKEIISSSGNEALKGLKGYKAKKILKSAKDTARLKKIVPYLVAYDSPHFTPPILLHVHLCEELERRFEDKDADIGDLERDAEGIDAVSSIPSGLGRLENIQEADLREIAESVLAYSIVSLVLRGSRNAGDQAGDNSLESRVTHLIDLFASYQPLVDKKTEAQQRVAQLFNEYAGDFCMKGCHIALDYLKKESLCELVGSKSKLNYVRKATKVMLAEFQSQPTDLSKIVRLYEALRVSLLTIHGVQIDKPTTKDAAQNRSYSMEYTYWCAIDGGLRRAPKITYGDCDYIAASLLSFAIIGYVDGHFKK